MKLTDVIKRPLITEKTTTARDIVDTAHVIATREALEKLQEALG